MEIRRMVVALGLIGSLVNAASAAAASRSFTVRADAAVPQGGYVECFVQATGTTPIGIVAEILASDGSDSTQWSTGTRLSPAVTGDGRYYADQTVGSYDPATSSCTATVTGARRSDIDIKVTSYDASGNTLAIVTGK